MTKKNNKQAQADQIAAFIAKNGITLCESSENHAMNAKSLRQMRAKQESLICGDGAVEDMEDEFDIAQAAEQSQDRYHRARSAARASLVG